MSEDPYVEYFINTGQLPTMTSCDAGTWRLDINYNCLPASKEEVINRLMSTINADPEKYGWITREMLEEQPQATLEEMHEYAYETHPELYEGISLEDITSPTIRELIENSGVSTPTNGEEKEPMGMNIVILGVALAIVAVMYLLKRWLH